MSANQSQPAEDFHIAHYILYDTLRFHSLFSVFTLGYSEGTLTQRFNKLPVYKNEVMWFPTLFYYSAFFSPLPPASVCWKRE